MHVLAAEQFSPEQLEPLFQQTTEFIERYHKKPVARRELATRHLGHVMCSFFYEESTRTRLSLETAAVKMGMGLVSTANARAFSSVAKGETLEDTIQVLNEYDYSVIAMRHDETGSLIKAASLSETPIINGGDGKGEHPTQALLDAYTIEHNKGRLDNLHIVMGGDLANGRTVHSLSQLMAKYPNNRITYVSMPELQIGDDIKLILDDHDTPYQETTDMYDAVRDADVVYWTRLQKERLPEDRRDSIPHGGFTIDQTALEIMPEDAIIMHPLPRVTEITKEVDNDRRAVYFTQSGNGLYVRMALLDQILTNKG